MTPAAQLPSVDADTYRSDRTVRPSEGPTLALSIRQPWCHRILHEGKDVENRDWPTRVRGQVLIHASGGVDPEDRAEVKAKAMPTGCIVGVMEIVDCVTSMDSDWFHGRYGFVLRNARPLPLIRCKGALGFFRPLLSPAQMATLYDALERDR